MSRPRAGLGAPGVGDQEDGRLTVLPDKPGRNDTQLPLGRLLDDPLQPGAERRNPDGEAAGPGVEGLIRGCLCAVTSTAPRAHDGVEPVAHGPTTSRKW